MNLRNVARLISIEIKTGRLIRGQRLRKYRERRIFQYLLYGGACVLGLLIGIAIGNFYYVLPDSELKSVLYQIAHNIFASLPTLVLLYSFVFTMMGQIQRAGIRYSIQPPYWLPITWEEHTLASTLSHIIGLPLASIVLLASAIIVFTVFLGELPLAVFTIYTLLLSVFLASMTTEIFKTLQTKFIGAIYKSSGKVAVWVRFLGSLLFFIIFYVVWFSLSSGTGFVALIKSVTGVQETVWFIPYVWLGVTLTYFMSGLLTQTIIFSLASLLFILALFYVAARLNSRFGMYELPAITVSRGVYTPKTGILEKLGFSSLENAAIMKDFKAFTRRRELMYVFVMPLVFILMPLMQYLGAIGNPVPPEASPFLFAWIFLAPGTFMVMILGTMIIGEEGGSVWILYSSPITPKILVKCKYAFVIILSYLVMVICAFVGILIAQPSLNLIFILLVESTLLIFALGIVSLRSGIRGAEFIEIPSPKMVRPLTILVNTLLCLIIALAILSPLIPHAIEIMNLPVPLLIPKINTYVAVSISAIIALIITLAFYKIALKNAEKFLIKAEI